MAAPLLLWWPKNIHKKFGSLEVLKGISVTAETGDVISIIGSSGSGKKHLFYAVSIFWKPPTPGASWVGGEEIKVKTDSRGRLMGADNKQIDRVRMQLGMVFQSFKSLVPHDGSAKTSWKGRCMCSKRPKKDVQDEAMALLNKVGHLRQARKLSLRALRRSAAAGGHSPGPGHAAVGTVVRRNPPHLWTRSWWAKC